MDISQFLPVILVLAALAIAVLLGIGISKLGGRSHKELSQEIPPRLIESDEEEKADLQPSESDAAISDDDQKAAGSSAISSSTEGQEEGEPAQDSDYVSPRLDIPESVPTRMQKIRARLSRSGAMGQALLSILSRGELSESDWEEIEETLLMADVGLEATDELLERLRTRVKVENTRDSARIHEILREELITLVGPDMDRSLDLSQPSGPGHGPAVVMMVGVNGTGKTTTSGKLARLLVAEEKTVLLGAADTFRAAAADQLQTWGERVGVKVVRSDREGADPASVAFDAVKVGIDENVNVVVVDTAGRLQNKTGLMDELGKIRRVIERQVSLNEVLLVLDATTGQNGMIQAKAFAQVAGITGIVLTKLDGTAKGGIVISVQRELGVPVKFIGVGEGADDLAPFDPEAFVDALLK